MIMNTQLKWHVHHESLMAHSLAGPLPEIHPKYLFFHQHIMQINAHLYKPAQQTSTRLFYFFKSFIEYCKNIHTYTEEKQRKKNKLCNNPVSAQPPLRQ